MRRRRVVGRNDRPIVIQYFDRGSAHVDHRFYSQSHSGSQFGRGSGCTIIRDLRCFMKVAADSVAHKFSDYAESVGLDFILDSRADFTQTVAIASVFNSPIKSIFGHSKETLHLIIHNPNGDRRRGIADEAAQHDTNIQLHDIPVLNPAGAANSMNNLVVHRNADMTGKLPVTEEAAPATGP